MKTQYEIGDVFKNKYTGDNVVVIGNIPVACKIPNESPNWHPDDPIDLSNGNWHFVENRNIEELLIKQNKKDE